MEKQNNIKKLKSKKRKENFQQLIRSRIFSSVQVSCSDPEPWYVFQQHCFDKINTIM